MRRIPARPTGIEPLKYRRFPKPARGGVDRVRMLSWRGFAGVFRG